MMMIHSLSKIHGWAKANFHQNAAYLTGWGWESAPSKCKMPFGLDFGQIFWLRSDGHSRVHEPDGSKRIAAKHGISLVRLNHLKFRLLF